ncbi:MAG: ABC transporter permease [Bacilli bacterium]|nr:ABC transporter permease [Bacilli bacterium]MDD4718847.1 ABC transporter permease [Bacilli bacterium]
MKILNNLTLKYLKMNKKKMLVSIIGILLSSTLLFTIGLGFSTVKQVTIDYAQNERGSQHVTFETIPYSNIELLEQDSNIDKVIIEEVIDNYNYEYAHLNCSANIIRVNVLYEDYITLSTGRIPTSENEIIVPISFARHTQLNVNDTIKDYIIVGVYEKSLIHYYQFYEGHIYSEEYIYINGDINKDSKVNFYVEYKSINNIFNKINKTADSLNLDYKINNKGKNAEARQYENTDINYSLLSAHGKYEIFKQKLTSYSVLGLILFVLSSTSILVIFNSFTISLSERKKYIGILRSVGITNKQLYKSMFFETSLFILISIPVSFILSFILTSSMLSKINNMLEGINVIAYKLTIYPSYMIISFVFILITVYLSAFFSIYVTEESSVIDLIRLNDDVDIEKGKDNKLIRRIFGVEGELAYKNITRNKSKHSVALTTICITIVLFITFATIINYAIKNNQLDLKSDFDINLMIPISDNREKIINEISNIKEVDEVVVYKSNFLNFKLPSKDKINDKYYNYIANQNFDGVSIYGFEKESFDNYKKKLKIKDDTRNIIYNQKDHYLANENPTKSKEIRVEIFKNENISLEFCDVDFQSLERKECYYTLDNFYLTDTYFVNKKGQFMIVVDMETYNEIIGEANKYLDGDNETWNSYLQIGINSKKFEEFDVKIAEIIKSYPNVDITYHNAKLDNYKEYMSVKTTEFIMNSLITFIAIIALTSVYNTINTSIILRERDFSMLRSVGLSKQGFYKMIKLESVFLGLRSLLYGIPLSLLVVLIFYIIDYLGQRQITMIFPTKYFIICFIGVIVIIFLTMWYSFSKVKDKNIIDSIKNENI